MSFTELTLKENVGHLKNIYDKIHDDLMLKEGFIKNENFVFNNHIGDITKNIRWTWAINNESIKLFDNIIKDLYPKINKYFNNNFKIFSCSFITLYEKEITNSEFHLDISDIYNENKNINILTLIFPLYIDEDMGGLEYKDNEKIKIYKYKKNKVFVWDACKCEHRTQPYKLLEKKKRVLVSINLCSDNKQTLESINNTLKYQGFIKNDKN